MLLGGFGERLPYFVIALVVWWFGASNPTLALILYFLMIATTALGNGIATPAWFTMIGKVLPVNRRGIFFGVSEGIGALMGIVGAYYVGRVLDTYLFPGNFALLFALAFGFTAISWVGLALNREPESPIVKDHVPLTQYLKKLPIILRENGNYRQFLISYAVSKLGAMATGFFIIFGNDSFDLSGEQIGLLTGILIGSQAVMNLVWGLVGDRIGHKTVLLGSAFAFALAAIVAWFVSSFVGLVVAFILLGAGISGDNVSKFSIVLEFCAPEDQPTYIGLTNTLLAPVVTLAPLIGGWLADGLGFRFMFGVAAVFALLGGALLTLWVKEPRFSGVD